MTMYSASAPSGISCVASSNGRERSTVADDSPPAVRARRPQKTAAMIATPRQIPVP
jgi:hypothetical protein